MRFSILDEWDTFLGLFPPEKKDIYFTKKYTSLYESKGNIALCAVCEEGDRMMLMPFIRGEVRGRYDFETAYGYGGAIINHDDREWHRETFNALYDFLKQENYVCGFTRFHPLLQNEKMVNKASDHGETADNYNMRDIEVLYDRQTIAIDTSVGIEDIWMNQISSKNRNMIRKAKKNGLVYKSEFDFESLEDFRALYYETMKRLNADSFYFFGDKYFEDFVSNMEGNAFLGTVRKGGELICAALFMYSECYGHYHLEGSSKGYPSLGANNFLLWKATCEMHDLGIREFHLGGGMSASLDDPLFKFKKAFSNNTKEFYIGKEIFNPLAYENICNEWVKCNSKKNELYGSRLLKYRY